MINRKLTVWWDVLSSPAVSFRGSKEMYWIPFVIRIPKWLLRRWYGAAFWLPEHKRTEATCTEDDSLYCCGRHCHH